MHRLWISMDKSVWQSTIYRGDRNAKPQYLVLDKPPKLCYIPCPNTISCVPYPQTSPYVVFDNVWKSLKNNKYITKTLYILAKRVKNKPFSLHIREIYWRVRNRVFYIYRGKGLSKYRQTYVKQSSQTSAAGGIYSEIVMYYPYI